MVSGVPSPKRQNLQQEMTKSQGGAVSQYAANAATSCPAGLRPAAFPKTLRLFWLRLHGHTESPKSRATKTRAPDAQEQRFPSRSATGRLSGIRSWCKNALDVLSIWIPTDIVATGSLVTLGGLSRLLPSDRPGTRGWQGYRERLGVKGYERVRLLSILIALRVAVVQATTKEVKYVPRYRCYARRSPSQRESLDTVGGSTAQESAGVASGRPR